MKAKWKTIQMKKIYIAGKVTGEPREECEAKFQRAENRIKSDNTVVINPLKFIPKGTDWKIAMKICIMALIACDAVYALEDWHESKGATLEMQIAMALGMEFINFKTVKKWKML